MRKKLSLTCGKFYCFCQVYTIIVDPDPCGSVHNWIPDLHPFHTDPLNLDPAQPQLLALHPFHNYELNAYSISTKKKKS